jgi:predicted kinase
VDQSTRDMRFIDSWFLIPPASVWCIFRAAMEAVIFIGIQGSGKSTFYEQYFASTHARLNLDTLKTRHQENLLLQKCLHEGRDFVVDNTNPTVEQRRNYVESAKNAGYTVLGYFFDVPIQDCIERNKSRTGKARIPVPALYGTRKKLQPPALAEGFDKLFRVTLDGSHFGVQPMPR